MIVVESNFETAVRSCAAAMVTSGTATLHTALLDVPMVIAYRVSPLSYLIGRVFIRVQYIGIVNLIAGREVVREFIQDRANAENLARECSDLIGNNDKRARILEDLPGHPGKTRQPKRCGKCGQGRPGLDERCTMTESTGIYKRVLELIRPHWSKLILAMVCMVGVAAA